MIDMVQEVEVKLVRNELYDGGGVGLVILTGRGSGRAYAKSLTFTTLGKNRAIEPCCHLEPKEAQALMDRLWDAGLRPTEGTGSAGAMAATQNQVKAVEHHLEDMRKMAFKMFDHLANPRLWVPKDPTKGMIDRPESMRQ